MLHADKLKRQLLESHFRIETNCIKQLHDIDQPIGISIHSQSLLKSHDGALDKLGDYTDNLKHELFSCYKIAWLGL